MQLATNTPVLQLVSHPDDKPHEYRMYIDNSSISQFVQCPRQWHYSHVLRRRANRRSSALGFGAAVHTALENLNGFNFTGKRDQWPAWFAANSESIYRKALAPCTFGESDQRTYDNFTKLCTGYFYNHPLIPEYVTYGEAGTPIIESPFECPLLSYDTTCELTAVVGFASIQLPNSPSPELRNIPANSTIKVYLIGKIDFATWEGEFAAVNDFKTASGKYTTPSEYATIFQFKGYAFTLWKLFSILPAYSRVHQLILTKSGKVDFDIITNTINEHILNEYHTEISSIVRTIFHCAESGTFYACHNACHNKFGTCQFKTACEWPDSATRSQLLYSDLYTYNEWDPRAEND